MPPKSAPDSGRRQPRPANRPAHTADTAETAGEHNKKDERTAQMPHDTEADDARPATSPPLPARPRPPVPSLPPQPPPPTGEPLTSATLGRARSTPGMAMPPEAATTSVTGSAGAGVTTARSPVRTPGGRREEEYDSGPPTAQLRAIRDKPATTRPAPRTVAAAVCLVLGVGLLGGAAAGTWFTGDPGEQATAEEKFDHTRGLWHSVPVNTLFPREIKGVGAGPGRADRHWVRVAVAPDSDCRHVFDPLLAKALSPVGCSRLVRATYADETTSSVTTVGLLFTRTDASGMRSLRKRFAVENLSQRTDLMPRPYSARGTVAADFGDAQRASWTIRVLTDAPVVAYAVTGFADGRVVSDPQSAAQATAKNETSPAAQAGLGHDAQGIADRIERRLREASTAGRGEDDQ
ncbi:MAG: hypothetical protein ACRDP3_21785 [Streptomyces sp.]|uniref:hypothetical protein n=1 Tax=Streptomyces sp. TaxID=1931 RepID=UPI003D6B9216